MGQYCVTGNPTKSVAARSSPLLALYLLFMRPFSVVLVLFAAACAKPKVKVPEFLVAQTADTVIVPVVNLGDAVPRSDGRWVVLATNENEILVVDFTTRKSMPFPGITKEEVPGPTRLIGAGDTLIVSDWNLRRITAWVAGEKRLTAWPVPEGLRGAFPSARDAAGQWYFELPPIGGPDGAGQKDSAAIVRANSELTKFDTIARLAPPEIALSGPNGSQWVRLALGGQDAWGVYPDGELWLARVFQNQLLWRKPGADTAVRSPLLPDPVRFVQEMDRQIYLRRFPEENRAELSKRPFAGVKPPFERAFATPDRRIWLFKSGVALDSVRAFQVVDATGLLLVVRVPSRGVALGVDGSHILMAEEFPGGIRLLRYPVPKEALASK